MKNFCKIFITTVLLSLLFVGTAWADEWDWNMVQGHHNESILLNQGETSAEDSFYQYGRGEYLAEGSVQIVNQENGDIYIRADTYAYLQVDRILHTIFLDVWVESENDWDQVGYWDFEQTKEEADGDLTMLTTIFTLTGYETNRYYRVRGLHGVELNDELEACATETDGVLITDN